MTTTPGDVVRVREDCELLTLMPELKGQIGVVISREDPELFEDWMPGAVLVKLMDWEDVIFFADDELEVIPKVT